MDPPNRFGEAGRTAMDTEEHIRHSASVFERYRGLSISDQFVANLGELIRRQASDAPARRVPSAQECKFCDIRAVDCPERVEEGSWSKGATTDDF